MGRRKKSSRKKTSRKKSNRSKNRRKSRSKKTRGRKKSKVPLIKKYQETTKVPISKQSVDVIDLQKQFHRVDREIKQNISKKNIPDGLKAPVMYLDKPSLLKKLKK